jgi:HPt (histidine-containing phosphotransfer) domain-containing protein
MTASARREDRDRCLIEGMDSYLAKPVSKDALLASVARFVNAGSPAIASKPKVVRASPDGITIDLAVFDEIRILDEATEDDLLADLIGQFVHDTEPLLVELRDALERSDAVAVGRIAHSIKGSCLQLGGRRLASSCGRLGLRATSGSLSGGERDLMEVEIDYKELRSSLAEQLSAVDGRRTGSLRG